MSMKRIMILLGVWLLTATSCDYLNVKPIGKVIPEKSSEFRALLTSAYSTFPTHKKLLALRSDELFPMLYTPTYSSYIDLALLKDAGADSDTYTYPWQDLYKVIFYANSVIEGVTDAVEDGISDSREQLKGEAFLLRAYTHFELLNLYAKPYSATSAGEDRGIPLALEIDVDKVYMPESVEKVYTQILQDITHALELLDVEEQPAETRYRFSRKSALALLTRVRLYHEEWDLAQAVAEELLPSCPLEDLNEGEQAKLPYLYDSKEAILAMELTCGTDLVDDATVLPNLSEKYNADGDLRLRRWFRNAYGEYRADKCYDKSMRVTFRSAEIYLIAAEAAAHREGQLPQAKSYLKQLMEKRLTSAYYAEKAIEVDAMNQEQLLAEIADERARELALEGHRWYDLRRTTRPRIVKSYMDMNFEMQELVIEQNDSRYVIPFPQEATENNPNLRN